jgi:hypothetical protein
MLQVSVVNPLQSFLPHNGELILSHNPETFLRNKGGSNQ